MNLKNSKSSGIDRIDTYTIKLMVDDILPAVTHVVNLSIQQAVFPSLYKIAKVIPLYKKEDPHLTDNYRPISLLPVISKVFEKVAFKQVYNYFDKNKLLYKSQYGFRKKHSTELAGLEFNDKIVNANHYDDDKEISAQDVLQIIMMMI